MKSKVVIGQGNNQEDRALLNFLETGNLNIQNNDDGSQFELSKVKLSK